MKSWRFYRNGSMTLQERIAAALAHYPTEHDGALPVAVVVNPRNLEAARAVVRALDLDRLPVVGNGGVMVVECWLEIAEEKVRHEEKVFDVSSVGACADIL